MGAESKIERQLKYNLIN